MTATIDTISFAELRTQAETTATVTATGYLDFTVQDLRGNNAGFTAYLSCQDASTGAPCFTSDLAPGGIPASVVSVGGPTQVLSVTKWYGDRIAPAFALDATGQTLDHPVAVGGACATSTIGMGIYRYRVPLQVSLHYPYNEYVTLPVSWQGHFTLTLVEEQYPAGLCASATPVP